MMKRNWLALLLAAGLLLLAGCGETEKVIEGGGSSSGAVSSGTQTQGDTQSETPEEDDTQETAKGYVFVVQGTALPIDADISTVTDALGEPLSYYEAASCAFDGLDKIYTYAGFTVQTYPDSDSIYMIVLKDDSVSTQEGISIGDTLEQVVAAYGSDYTEETGMIVYRKDGMKLSFIIQEDEVVSIEYSSMVYDE